MLINKQIKMKIISVYSGLHTVYQQLYLALHNESGLLMSVADACACCFRKQITLTLCKVDTYKQLDAQ